MKYSLITAALAAPVVFAAPTKRQNIDTTVLQFALTLEHLENVFYKGALQKFSQADFQNAGYGASYYNNLRYIAYDEQSHVQVLSSALQAAGQTPTAACTYNFPYTNVASFVTLSSVLEGVGTSAYLGGAPLITSKDYLTAAGSILVAEALHTSLQRYAIGEVAAANPYGTPLDPTSVYTLAAAFIKSCPSTNPTLPFTPFPALTAAATTSKCSAGQSTSFTTTKSIPAGSYLTFVSGLSVVSVQATVNGMSASAAVPSAASGQTYVFITKAAASGNKLDGSSVLFGPAIIEVAPAAPAIDFNQQQ